MKLSQIDENNLTDKEISDIVFSDIEDNGLTSQYALVFGNQTLINERTNKAVEMYKLGRTKKIIFMGGTGGISNKENSNIPEAIKMKELAIKLGVDEKDIITEEFSNNTFENIDNALKIINKDIENIMVITSEFHLKRCYAILKKKYTNLNVILISAKDGFSDSDNWFLSNEYWNSGRNLVKYEAQLLIKYAKENKIADLEINKNII